MQEEEVTSRKLLLPPEKEKVASYIQDIKTAKDSARFRCVHCEKTFTKSINLQYHTYKHTGNKSYSLKSAIQVTNKLRYIYDTVL